MSEVTQVLASIERGEAQAGDLLPLVYEELRRLAAHRMSHESPNQTLQPTTVHEAWLRLVDKGGQGQFKNRAHFFGAAAGAMRRIMIDRARRKRAQRRGGGRQRVDLQEADIATEAKDDELLALDEALDKFAVQHKAKAELVKLRYFTGLTIAETADILGISEPTPNAPGPSPAPGCKQESTPPINRNHNLAARPWAAGFGDKRLEMTEMT